MLFSCSCQPLPKPLVEWHQIKVADSGHTDLLQTPGDVLPSRVPWTSLQSAMWGLEGTIRMVLQFLLPSTGVFVQDCLLPEGQEYSEHRVLHLVLHPCPFLPYQTWLPAPVLSRPVMTGLYSNICYETGMSIKAGSSKYALKVHTFEL